MPKKILIIIFVLFTNLLFAQEWTEPIIISTMQGYNDSPDLCVDSLGVLHCVWSHKIEDNYRKIYYSKSENYGETWSIPEDVSLNDSMWMSNPHVECDSENNLFLAYDYNTGDPDNMLILLKKFDGIAWNEIDTVSINLPGSMHNRIVIDYDNRVYIFWFYFDKIYYRFLEDKTFSEVMCTHCGDSDLYFLSSVISDNNNNLHCIGRYLKDNNYDNDIKAIYLNYDFFTDQWQEKFFLSGNKAWSGSDIYVDKNQNPHLTWREPTTDSPPYNDATFYTYFNGYSWASNEIVVEDPDYQTIAVDYNNNVHIANQEKTDEGYQLVHYRKIQNNWEGEIIDTAGAVVSQGNLVAKNSNLYIVYSKGSVPYEDVNITFSKNQIINNTENTIKYYYTDVLEQNYPNPLQNYTVINFYLNNPGYTSLKILDLQGCTIRTLANEQKSIGEYSIIWDGTNQYGNKVTPGIYLYRLRINNRIITRSLIVY